LKTWGVVFLVRDPRDVIVSDYFQKAYRDPDCAFAREIGINKLQGKRYCRIIINDTSQYEDCSCFPETYSVHNLLTEKPGGFETILYYNSMFIKELPNKAAKVLLVRYEDLQQDGHNQLRQVLKFLDIDNVSDLVLNETVQASSFEEMRKLELDDKKTGTAFVFNPSNLANPNTYKTREGKIGGYKSYFNQIEIDWMISKMNAILPPILRYT